MKKFLLPLLAICLLPLTALAQGPCKAQGPQRAQGPHKTGPVRQWFHDHRPGILVHKEPQYQTHYQTQRAPIIVQQIAPSGPLTSGPRVVVGAPASPCPNGQCPLPQSAPKRTLRYD